MNLLLSISLASLLASAGLYAAAKAPVKPLISPSHHSSSDQDGIFASAYASNLIQIISFSDDNLPIRFNVNQSHTPQHISHSLSSDDSKFGIRKGGIYQITWSIGFYNAANPDTVSVQLFNMNTSTFINPIQTTTFCSAVDAVIAGQTIVEIHAGTVIQLIATSFTSAIVPTHIETPIITIKRISP